MRYLRRAFGVVALVLIAFVTVGILLPGRWTVERSAEIGVPRDSLFATLERPEGWKAWMPWPEEAEALEGPRAGPGAGFAWDDARYGSGRFILTGTEPPRSLTYEVSVEEGAMRVRGRIRLQEAGHGTRIEWRETGEFGWNPILGYAALTMEERQGRQLERVLDGLGRELEGAQRAPP